MSHRKRALFTLVFIFALAVVALLIVTPGASPSHEDARRVTSAHQTAESDQPGCGFDYNPCASTLELEDEARRGGEPIAALSILGLLAFGLVVVGVNVRAHQRRVPLPDEPSSTSNDTSGEVN